jgi:hypothetical protein
VYVQLVHVGIIINMWFRSFHINYGTFNIVCIASMLFTLRVYACVSIYWAHGTREWRHTCTITFMFWYVCMCALDCIGFASGITHKQTETSVNSYVLCV